MIGAAVSAYCVGGSAASAQSAQRSWIRISEHVDITDIPDATYDQGMTNATTQLATSEVSGTADPVCNMAFARNGTWEYWGYGNGTTTINTDTEYRDVQLNAGGNLIIVDNINWCLNFGSFVGCGWTTSWPAGGTGEPAIMIRAGAASTQRGSRYLHEYSHTLGGQHVTNTNNILNLSVEVVDKRTTATQCSLLKTFRSSNCNNYPFVCSQNLSSGPPILNAAPGGSQASTGADAEEEVSFEGIPIEQVARLGFEDRVPAEVEDFYGPRDVATLRAMLKNPAEKESHHTVASLIGLITTGEAGDVEALTSYFQQSDSNKGAAGIALGYVVSRTRNPDALRFLLAHRADSTDGAAVGATIGLALSGHANALASLREPGANKMSESRRGLQAQAVRHGEEVARLGLREYYRNPPKPQPLEGGYPGRVAGKRARSPGTP